jgi:hypothetical protein
MVSQRKSTCLLRIAFLLQVDWVEDFGVRTFSDISKARSAALCADSPGKLSNMYTNTSSLVLYSPGLTVSTNIDMVKG